VVVTKNSLSLLEEGNWANDVKTWKQWQLHFEHGILVPYKIAHYS